MTKRSRARVGHKLFAVLALWVSSTTSTATAFAQAPSSADEARAVELYEEGTRLLDAGELEPACAKLDEALRLVPDASGAHLALGVCLQRSGRLASALTHFERAYTFAEALSERRRRAQAHAEEVRARVGRVVVTVGGGAPASAAVRIDGRAVASGAPVFLDAGTHLVELVDGAQTLASQSVLIRDGSEAKVVLGAPAPAGETPPDVGEKSASHLPWGTIGVVSLGVGGAGLVLGAVAGGVAADRDSASQDACDARDFCTGEGIDARNAAFTWATVSTVGFIAGGALVAAGVVVLILDPAEDDRAASTAPRAALGIGPGSVSLRGSF